MAEWRQSSGSTMPEQPRQCIVAIVPCNDIEASTAFYVRLGLLTAGVGPEHKPWGMYEFALSDPDGTLVRIGWPSRLILEPREQTA
jgi:hypothetical protein